MIKSNFLYIPTKTRFWYQVHTCAPCRRANVCGRMLANDEAFRGSWALWWPRFPFSVCPARCPLLCQLEPVRLTDCCRILTAYVCVRVGVVGRAFEVAALLTCEGSPLGAFRCTGVLGFPAHLFGHERARCVRLLWPAAAILMEGNKKGVIVSRSDLHQLGASGAAGRYPVRVLPSGFCPSR